MPRIKGVDIPNEKRIETSLTYIEGIGLETSKRYWIWLKLILTLDLKI